MFKTQNRGSAARSACAKPIDWIDSVTEVLTLVRQGGPLGKRPCCHLVTCRVPMGIAPEPRDRPCAGRGLQWISQIHHGEALFSGPITEHIAQRVKMVGNILKRTARRV